VIAGLRGEESIAELCRKEEINQNLFYRWSKEFLKAGQEMEGLGDAARKATGHPVKRLRAEGHQLKELLAEVLPELLESLSAASCLSAALFMGRFSYRQARPWPPIWCRPVALNVLLTDRASIPTTADAPNPLLPAFGARRDYASALRSRA
jgi:transposase-like protein